MDSPTHSWFLKSVKYFYFYLKLIQIKETEIAKFVDLLYTHIRLCQPKYYSYLSRYVCQVDNEDMIFLYVNVSVQTVKFWLLIRYIFMG